MRVLSAYNGAPPKAGGVTGSCDGRHTLTMYVHNMLWKFLPKYVLEFEIHFAQLPTEAIGFP